MTNSRRNRIKSAKQFNEERKNRILEDARRKNSFWYKLKATIRSWF